jgi:hypothetical protein
MKILCLVPTYGRRQSLLNNSLACFAAQDHEDKHLLIYDDLGTLKDCKIAGCFESPVTILSNPDRCSSVGEKYNVMLREWHDSWFDYDAVAVWDDDDIYLPNHLSTHAAILQDHGWSKPSSIISAYHEPPAIESARGRFHGSIAVRRDLLMKAPWIDTTRATFDQEYLSLLQTHTEPGDPCTIAPPQYVYRWQTSKSGHCSGLMGSSDWYAKYQPDSREPISSLWPQQDADTERILQISATARI